jgi:hypothetical protein
MPGCVERPAGQGLVVTSQALPSKPSGESGWGELTWGGSEVYRP